MTEKSTEKETEKKTDTFSWSKDGVKVTVKLSGKDELPVSTKLSVERQTSGSDAGRKAEALVKAVVNEGHRELAGAACYKIVLKVDGKEADLSGKIDVTMEFDNSLDLGLSPYAQAEAAVFEVGEAGADLVDELKVDEDLKVKKVRLSADASSTIALAGIQNRENDGRKIKQKDLEDALEDVLDYAVVANEYSGQKSQDVLADKYKEDKDDETAETEALQDANAADAEDILKDLSKYSLILANGVSSDEVKIVNFYLDEEEEFPEEALAKLLKDDDLDLSEDILVVNIVTAKKDQKLKLPVFGLKKKQEEHVIYNVVAEDGDEFIAFTGEIELKKEGTGTYIVSEGSIDVTRGLLGAVYADKVTAEKVKKAVIGESETEEATEGITETETEAVTEESTETETEEITETEMEAITEEITETGTEEITEKITETETEEATEEITETETEAATEDITETEIEAMTEEITEGETEEALIEETEAATEVIDEEEAEEVSLDTTELAASAGKLTVTKKADNDEAVEGAVLVLEAAADITPAKEVTVKGKDGNNVTFEANEAAYTKGTEIYRWTTKTTPAEEEIGDYLIPGGSYKIREETTPGTEYSKAGDYYFSVDPDGKMKNSNGEEITSVTIIDSLTNENTLKVAVVDADATSTYLSGAEFVIMDEDGSLLKDANGNPFTFISENKVIQLNLDTSLNLADSDLQSFRLVEIKTKSGYQFTDFSEAVISISRDDDGNISLVLPEGSKYTKDGVLTFKNRKEPTGAAGTISVTVRNYFDSDPTDEEPGTQIYATNGATYYVALFSDADKTNRVSDVKTVKIKKGYKSATVAFKKLISGTYYVGETDEYGNVIGDIADPKQASDDFYAEFVHNGKKTSKVVIKVDEESQTAADTEVVNLNNQYFKLLPGFTYTAAFTVTKVVKDSDGSELLSNNTFYVGVYTKNSSGKYAYIGKKAIKMGGASQKTVTIELPMSASVKEKSVMVKEVDSKGNEVKSGEAYDIKVEPGEIVLKRGDTETPSVTITNTKVKGSTEDTETEDPGDLGDGKAELKLTKKVIYKDTAIRVNSVYYIGIFDDAGLKNLRYKKAMTFSNASELTATLKINLNKLSSREITFYFAEVDEQGKPLSGGKTFGYDISLNKKSVTLNSKNMADEIVVTNTVIDGGDVAQQLTDPSSGFAGDSAALATAQSLAADSNSSGKTKTGDGSPITPLIIVLIVSAAVILIAILVLVMRKKRRK